MFFVKGWRPISEVSGVHYDHYLSPRFEEIRQNVDDQARIKRVWNEINLAAYPAFWKLMDEVDRVAVLLGNGTVVDALPELVRGPGEPEESSSSNLHISLNVGTVGSSEAWWLGEGRAYYESEFPPGAHVHYGPFLGLPVLLPERFLKMAAGVVSCSPEIGH